MEIFGYVGYAILIALSIIWSIGVRKTASATAATTWTTLIFVLGAFYIPITHTQFAAAWIFLIGGFAQLLLYVPLVYMRPVGLWPLYLLIARVFAGILRVGISAEKLRRAQQAELEQHVNEWVQKQK